MAPTPRVALSQRALSALNDSVKVATARVGEAVAKSALDMYFMMLMVFVRIFGDEGDPFSLPGYGFRRRKKVA